MADQPKFGADNYVTHKKERQLSLQSKTTERDLTDLRTFIQDTLGQGIIVEPGAYNVDSYYSAIDSRHGLHFTIRGRADQVRIC